MFFSAFVVVAADSKVFSNHIRLFEKVYETAKILFYNKTKPFLTSRLVFTETMQQKQIFQLKDGWHSKTSEVCV